MDWILWLRYANSRAFFWHKEAVVQAEKCLVPAGRFPNQRKAPLLLQLSCKIQPIVYYIYDYIGSSNTNLVQLDSVLQSPYYKWEWEGGGDNDEPKKRFGHMFVTHSKLYLPLYYTSSGTAGTFSLYLYLYMTFWLAAFLILWQAVLFLLIPPKGTVCLGISAWCTSIDFSEFWTIHYLIKGRVTARIVLMNQEGWTIMKDFKFFLNLCLKRNTFKIKYDAQEKWVMGQS